MDDVTWIDWAPVVAAATGVLVAALVALMPFVRRPKVRIEEDPDRGQSHVEMSGLGALPHVRLLVTNAKRRRAAQGTRVLVEGYTVVGSHLSALTPLGHASLAWASSDEATETAAVTVFAGGSRAITLGYFTRVRRDTEGALHNVSERDYRPGEADAWYLRLTLAFGLSIGDDRDKLPPEDDGYVIRLLVGADDGPARTFNVHIDWDGDPELEPEQVLRSALDRLAVE